MPPPPGSRWWREPPATPCSARRHRSRVLVTSASRPPAAGARAPLPGRERDERETGEGREMIEREREAFEKGWEGSIQVDMARRDTRLRLGSKV